MGAEQRFNQAGRFKIMPMTDYLLFLQDTTPSNTIFIEKIETIIKQGEKNRID